MKKNLFVVYGKYKRLKNSKISYTLEKTLVLSIIFDKWGSEDEKIFKEESVETKNY